jgi:hypothetical protein
MKTIDKLKSLPRHGVLPRGGRGRARVTRAAAPPRSIAPARTPARAPEEELPVESPPEVSSINQQIEQLAQQRAQEIVAERDALRSVSRFGRTFTKFDMINDVVSKQTETVTAGLWSNSIASLTTFFTSSAQTTSQRRYYVDVHQSNPSLDGSACQFSIAYGHAAGSGSQSVGQLNDSPSRAINVIE